MLSWSMGSFGEQTTVLARAWDVWEFPWNLWVNNSIRCKLIVVLETSFDDEISSGCLSPPSFGGFYLDHLCVRVYDTYVSVYVYKYDV